VGNPQPRVKFKIHTRDGDTDSRSIGDRLGAWLLPKARVCRQCGPEPDFVEIAVGCAGSLSWHLRGRRWEGFGELSKAGTTP
jgi:hypothetical protein